MLETISGAEAIVAAKLGELAKAVVEERERLPVYSQIRIVESSLVGKAAAWQRRANKYVRLQAEMDELEAEIQELEKEKQALLTKQSQQRTGKATDFEAAALEAVAAKVEQMVAKVEEAGFKEELKAIVDLVRGLSPTPQRAVKKVHEGANIGDLDQRTEQVMRDSQGAQKGGSDASTGCGL